MSDIRGKDPNGIPRDVRLDRAGRIHVRLYGSDRYGNPQQLQVSTDGLLTTGTEVYQTPFTPIPGIGAAVAYADEDAFGTVFQLEVPTSGIIGGALAVDEDDEAVNVDLFLFNDSITSGTDNDAYAPILNDALKLVGILTFSTRKGVSGMTFSVEEVSRPYVAPEDRLWVQAVARGALNIAAAKQYFVSLLIRSD